VPVLRFPVVSLLKLCRESILINRKAVQRHMQEMGLAGICPGPNLSKRNTDHRVYPYLLGRITASYPNHVWGADITYVRLTAGWMYLVAVLDWFSRYVVSWALDQTLEMPLSWMLCSERWRRPTPVIWNSDQGSHFTSRSIRNAAGGQRADQYGRQEPGP